MLPQGLKIVSNNNKKHVVSKFPWSSYGQTKVFILTILQLATETNLILLIKHIHYSIKIICE